MFIKESKEVDNTGMVNIVNDTAILVNNGVMRLEDLVHNKIDVSLLQHFDSDATPYAFGTITVRNNSSNTVSVVGYANY